MAESHKRSLGSTRDDSLASPAIGLSQSVNDLVEWILITVFQLILGLTAPQLLSRAYFLPGILVNSLKLQISDKYKWHTRIDDTVVLGALPFRSQTKQVKYLCLLSAKCFTS